MDRLNQLLTQNADFLNQYAVLIVALAVAPLALLGFSRKIYPHVTQIALFSIPVILTLTLLIDKRLLALVLIIDLLIPLIALVDLFTIPRQKQLKVERQALKIASLQKPHRVTLQISNIGSRPFTAWVRDDIPQEFTADPKEFVLKLGAQSRTTVHYELTASRRGAYAMHCVHVRVRSWLGLWKRFYQYDAPSAIHVYPDMKQLAEFAILARTNRLSLMGVRRTRKVGTENDFERLRDYTLDDNYKFIDWRASARRNKLTVKDFQTSQSQRLIFLVDCGRLMTNQAAGISLLDHALNAVLMLSYVALRQGDSVGMICFADKVLSFVPPRGGMNQMNQLLHSSFDRFPELVESRYDDAFLYLHTHCKKRSLVVLITNVIDEVNSHQIQSYLGNVVGQHLPLGVLLRDHHLFDAADRDPRSEEELFRGAAAAEILSWRHQVLRDLEHTGVLSLDVFPEDMTAPLVNQYLNIKARHLL
ncbi:hypothetical protein ETAA8_43040 [Anatilimnocola aggregata]|uniref:DUF58 domain-containing protein n=1 Tax=Anatilimnocola aggregata TaxID=2528021 RepID=A0A517YG35_9BACT|nr:DUF58 domain-containing protein [Anatilimnocola aggregata]QDU29197.1 hypothetical protein ETAA8_43040 [Anatilimnocola aggregata]